ncbi:PAS domain S-box [Xenococcus sp. PCC 7305]|uniref:PAS domain S-box protein n=1 Tax=Xenococcus sp. PCC 7305 TaxID=102125 RepID=UPI0002ACA5F5|nr:PAS domain S-box protein [Xenococcus sp. PCC 7305]ELS01907.1 PAS domain S-box [Xenococcus sp. PCC 7305]
MEQAKKSIQTIGWEKILARNLLIVAPEISVRKAIALMSPPKNKEHGIAQKSNQGFDATKEHSCILIVENKKLVGIFTKSDLLRLVTSQGDFLTLTLGEVMSRPVITLQESQLDNLARVLSYMQQHSWSHLPVLDQQQQIRGIITQESLYRVLVKQKALEIANQQQKQEELESFFEITPSMLCVAGFDGYFKRLNNNFQQVLGFTKDELLAQPFINFVHPDDRAATLAELDNIEKGKITVSFENRYLTNHGSYRWFLWSATAHRQEQKIYAAARDITKRKHIELELQESQERWQLALQGSNDGIWDWNVVNNEVFFSKRWKEMLGYQEDEIQNHLEEWSKRVHPDDIDWVNEQIQNHFAKKTPSYISEHRVLCKDGSYKWILDRGQALWDKAGNPIRMTVSYADITDRKQAELELKQERDFTKAILDTVGALVTVLNREGQIVSFNNTCEEVTGYDFSEVQGKKIWDFLIIAQEKKSIRAVFAQLFAGQLPNQYENYWLAKDGSRHLISWSNTALFDDQGKVEFVIATGIDVTQQRQVQTQLEHQYRQTQLLAEVTRKIRVSIKLDTILQNTVTEIQNLLVCDRAMVAELTDDKLVKPVSEAVLEPFPAMLGYELAEPFLMNQYLAGYHQGKTLVIPDATSSAIPYDVRELFQQFSIKAILVVPILTKEQLKGLLIVHQCNNTRYWKKSEIKLLQQLADQIGVALSQAELLNNLEESVKKRTLELTLTNQRLQAEIEERELTEISLRENQERLAGILDNADEAIIAIDERQQIQLFNKGAERIFGYRASEVMGEELDILLPEIFREIHRQHVEEFHKSPQRSRTMSNRSSHVYGRRKHGEEFPAEASISKLQTQDGLIFTVMLQDITERQQAAAKLQRSENQLKLITDSLPILIAYVDHQQRYRYINQTYQTWFRKSRQEFLGLRIEKIVGKINYRKILPYIERALSGEEVTFEIEPLYVPENSQNSRWMNATYIPDINAEGKVKGFFAMIEDITERKAIEQMKSEFVSVASHEMRTPLTSIHGVLKLMATGHLGKFSDRGQEMIQIAVRNTDRLVRLINDVLDIERMESGKEIIETAKITSAELISQAVDTAQEMAQQHQITIETKPNSIDLLVDSDRILQTLTNLLSNAIKFSPPGSKVWLTAKKQGNEVIFAVKDQGRGIPQDKLENIFERFQQVDASDSRKKGGTGLGLAICRHIVEQHGGRIWATSTLGKGSSFFFTLPQVKG